MWWVYLLRCKDNTLYCGITTDLDRRVFEHNFTGNAAKYTRSRRPVSLVWSRKVENRSSALKMENKIKKLPKKSKEMMIESFVDFDNAGNVT